ncbi:MAG TPA: helix-turn-helix domain-containing protein [Hyphomicrobiales bacterium]|nr:helix-turn-helix domain-containing protein [Rhodobiaceae bacterium]HXK54864.1 helix-turn-helix domain-containing protein [Hyphomicrobiales bacterium]
METMDIGEVAAISGLPASTLRFYEARGLIKSIGRHGLRRVFKEDILRRLEFIALGRRAGFSLDEIAGMFTAGGLLRIDRRLMLAKADDLDDRIAKMKAVRDGLRHAARCSAPSHLECPKFLRLLRLAGKQQAKERRRPPVQAS